jgi:hypothetical protein
MAQYWLWARCARVATSCAMEGDPVAENFPFRFSDGRLEKSHTAYPDMPRQFPPGEK